MLAAVRTILLEQGDTTATTPGVTYEAWLVNTLVPMWFAGWVAIYVYRLTRRVAARWATAAPVRP